jgi:hypothetical protein
MHPSASQPSQHTACVLPPLPPPAPHLCVRLVPGLLLVPGRPLLQQLVHGRLRRVHLRPQALYVQVRGHAAGQRLLHRRQPPLAPLQLAGPPVVHLQRAVGVGGWGACPGLVCGRQGGVGRGAAPGQECWVRGSRLDDQSILRRIPAPPAHSRRST